MNIKKEIVEKTCENCQNLFVVSATKRNLKKRFCSSLCAKSHNGKNNAGKKHSDEINKKKGRSGKENAFFGKTHSEESKQKAIKSRYEISLKKSKRCQLTKIETEILDGMMLADASIEKSSSISSRITYGSNLKKTIEDIVNSFKSINFSKIYTYEATSPRNKNKKYIHYFIKSLSYYDLTEQRNRWYKDEKIIPKDINLTPNSCLWWFIGDGYCNYANVILCTECFSFDDKMFLTKRLKQVGFNAKINTRGRIYLDKKSSYSFLLWILKEKEFPIQYVYKLKNYNKQSKKFKLEL